MEESSIDVTKILQQLSEGILSYDRIDAARSLGRLPYSNEEIIKALLTAQSVDDHAGVREAAALALETGVHETFLKEHPELVGRLQAIVRDAAEARDQAEQNRVTDEFMQRRARERIISLFPLLIVTVYCVTGIALIEQSDWLYPTGSVIMFLLMGGVAWLSYRNWRCPACDSWLGGLRGTVNPLWSSSPTWCPHCGKKLM